MTIQRFVNSVGNLIKNFWIQISLICICGKNVPCFNLANTALRSLKFLLLPAISSRSVIIDNHLYNARDAKNLFIQTFINNTQIRILVTLVNHFPLLIDVPYVIKTFLRDRQDGESIWWMVQVAQIIKKLSVDR